MSSYIPIRIVISNNVFTAKLYGDKIICNEANLNLNKLSVKKYRFDIFRGKIHLFDNNDVHIETNYNKIILSWFDPLFTLRVFTLGIFILSPVSMGILLIKSKFAWAFIPVSFAAGLLGYCFFKITSHQSTNPELKVFLLLLFICMPVVYWYPISGYILAAFAITILAVYMSYYLYSNFLNIKKYFFSISWLAILIFFYFWLIAAFQTMIIFSAYQNTKYYEKISWDKDGFVLNKSLWSKPVDWEVKSNSLFSTLLNRRSLLWTLSPYPARLSITSDLLGDFGWISYIPLPPEITLSHINNQLSAQKKILLSEIMEIELKKTKKINGADGILQTFAYYDMIERKLFKIILLIKSEKKDEENGSIIFALRIPATSSVNYYVNLITEGFAN